MSKTFTIHDTLVAVFTSREKAPAAVTAKPVTIPGFDDAGPWVVFKDDDVFTTPEVWRLLHVPTGMAVGAGDDTPQKAVENGVVRLINAGYEKLKGIAAAQDRINHAEICEAIRRMVK